MKGLTLSHKKDNRFISACKKLSCIGLAGAGATVLGTLSFGAPEAGGSDIWWWLDSSLKDVYGKILGVSTIAACLAAALCLVMMTFSTDDRAVSSSRSWLKRIAISWIILNVLGYIMAYLVNLTAGGNYTA